MNRKFIFIVGAALIILFIFYKIISYFNLNITISKLKEYKLKKNEKVHTKFQYNNYNYALTSYSSNASSHDNNHILLNHKNKYYLLESIDKCDMNSYIDDVMYSSFVCIPDNLSTFKKPTQANLQNKRFQITAS